jgi:hypothetical protein
MCRQGSAELRLGGGVIDLFVRVEGAVAERPFDGAQSFSRLMIAGYRDSGTRSNLIGCTPQLRLG